MALAWLRKLRRDFVKSRDALVDIPSILKSISEYAPSLLQERTSVGFHLRNLSNESSAKFILANLNEGTLVFRKKNSLWDYVISLINTSDPDSLLLEFGVYKGESISYFANHLPRRVFYGFDSFAGLKENWTGTPGVKDKTFKINESEVSVPKNVELVKGYFQDTLNDFLNKHRSQIAFIHIDSDTFESARYILENVTNRLAPNTVILFDEFIGYPGYEQGEFAAFYNWIGNRNYEYLAFFDQKALIRILT
jgi:predicted O-methyltransferase YrrM